MNKTFVSFLGAILCLPAAAVAAAEGAGWSLESIPWQEQAADGSRFALLEGSRDEAGRVFSSAFFLPAGGFDGPHKHSTTARVFVASGSLRLGYGTTPDPEQMITYPQGSYVVVPAGQMHFDGADVDTIIIGTAAGPWVTTYADPHATGSAGTDLTG